MDVARENRLVNANTARRLSGMVVGVEEGGGVENCTPQLYFFFNFLFSSPQFDECV